MTKTKPTANYEPVPQTKPRTAKKPPIEIATAEPSDDTDPAAVADCYIPLELNAGIDWTGADTFVWNALLKAVAQGDISAMRCWLTTRHEQQRFENAMTADEITTDVLLEDRRLIDFVLKTRGSLPMDSASRE